MPVYGWTVLGGIVYGSVVSDSGRVVMAVRVKKAALDRLDALAARLGVERSEAARRALAEGVAVLEARAPRGAEVSGG
jgi:predicted transcriptional regulator